MNLFKGRLEVLRKVCTVRTVVITFSVIAAVLSTSISMAGWVDDNGMDSNEVIYTDPITGSVGIGMDINSLEAIFHISTYYGRKGIRIDVPYATTAPALQIRYDGNQTVNIKAKGDSYFNGGDVGIGIENPDATFHILSYSGRKGMIIDIPEGTTAPALQLRHNGVQKVNIKVNGDSYFNGGDVGIGVKNPASKFHVVGTITATNYACSSDARYKKNISPYENALEKVLGLRGVSYFWKTDEYKERNFSKDKQVGFVAQEVEKVIPELVYTDDKGYKTMSYDRLTAVIVEAIKELKAQNDAKISALEKENVELKQRLAKLDGLAERLAVLEKVVENQGNNRLAKR